MRRYIFFISLVLMVLSSGVAYASDAPIIIEEEISLSELGVDDSYESEILIKSFRVGTFYSNLNDSEVNFGNQLSGNARRIYDYLTKLDIKGLTVNIPLEAYITFVSETAKPTEDELQPVYEKLRIITQKAVDAYNRDYPESYWFDIPESVYKYTYYGKEVDGVYKWSIKTITYEAAIDSEFGTNKDILINSYRNALNAFKVSGETRYEKLRSIYAGICNLVTYGTGKYASNAYGALVTKKAVCSGYAKAFKVICDREDIPCILISGISTDASGKKSEHMWNAVKMDDGKWYPVDVTWGDGSIGVLYELMLCGTDTKLTSVSNKTFAQSHVPSGDFSNTSIYIFKYPELSKTAYDPNRVVLTPTPSPTPTDTPNPVENPEPGDVNRDGVINANDALILLKVSAKILESSDDYLKYGDLNQDGILDAEDALIILKISAKIS